MTNILNIQAMCYGDVGLLLTIPGQGLGNSAIAAVANEEQSQRFGKVWAAMAITEPGCGSDSAAIRTTAVEDGDDYILNGEKIFITSGERADAIVVWATLDKKLRPCRDQIIGRGEGNTRHGIDSRRAQIGNQGI